jgi:hypothetical protein
MAKQGQVWVGERRDQEFADAGGRRCFEKRGLGARAHDAIDVDQQVAGLARAIEVDDRHPEDALHDRPMRDAGEFVSSSG